MPKGLTRNSSPIQVSGRLQETAANTFTSTEIDLTLNALDQEVFVITQLNLDVAAPDVPLAQAAVSSDGQYEAFVVATLSTTARSTVGSIADSNVIGQARRSITCSITSDPTVGATQSTVAFDREDPLFAPTSEEYIGIVATSNMHIQMIGHSNLNPKSLAVRVYGYRAKMDAAGYAALVQSQVLSA